jgi:hypothetical protein
MHHWYSARWPGAVDSISATARTSAARTGTEWNNQETTKQTEEKE